MPLLYRRRGQRQRHLGELMIIDTETKTPRAWGFVLRAQKDARIERNWNVIGMQGTGSHRIVIDGLVIDELGQTRVELPG